MNGISLYAANLRVLQWPAMIKFEKAEEEKKRMEKQIEELKKLEEEKKKIEEDVKKEIEKLKAHLALYEKN